ncbi:MAG: TolC family protein [Bacteroidia bacterium]
MKKYFASVFATLFFGNALPAQDNDTNNYSLQQCVEYAYQHQNNVLNSKLDEVVAHGKVKELIGIGLPQINGSFDVNDYLEKPTALLTGSSFGGTGEELRPIQFNLQYNGTGAINASQLIFDGSYIIGLKAAKTYETLASKQTTNTKIQTAVNVSKAYYGVLVGDARLGSLRSNIDRLQKTYDDTKATFAQGFVEKIDVDRIEVALNNLKTEENKAARLTELSIYLLKFQMGMDQNIPLTLTDKLQDLKIPEVAQLPDSVDFSNRIELDLVKAQFELQNYNVKRYKAQYYPNMTAYGGLGTSTNSENMDLFQSDKRWYWNSVVGIKVSMPIFDGGQRHYKIMQEKANLDKIVNNENNLQQAFILEYNTAKRNFTNSLSSFEFQKKNRKLAEDIVRVTKIKYEQGVGSNLEVVDAESKSREADSNFFTAMYEALISKIDLDKSMGNIK